MVAALGRNANVTIHIISTLASITIVDTEYARYTTLMSVECDLYRSRFNWRTVPDSCDECNISISDRTRNVPSLSTACG
jgi:hypothetical protein